jgi:hypothetical protein
MQQRNTGAKLSDSTKMKNNKAQTYNFICFTDLVYEFDFSEKKEIEKKIKRRLKYYKLGEYNQEIVDYIRQLKNDLYQEISQTTKSKYFHKSKSSYTDLADFDIQRMATDYIEKYDEVDKNELMGMINFAVYLYHLR